MTPGRSAGFPCCPHHPNCVFAPSFHPNRCCSSRQIKDSTHIRGIPQSLILASQNNHNQLPLPSILDTSNFNLETSTLSEKDLPRYILSYLIFNGYISRELTVSPAESNPNIKVFDTYNYKTAPLADPNLTLWDSAFKVTPKDTDVTAATQGIGHNSYAYLPPIGARKKLWSNSFSPTTAIMGNRGPGYALNAKSSSYSLLSNAPNDEKSGGVGSNTLLIHGGRTSWEGNVAYLDGAVYFESTPEPEHTLWTFSGASTTKKSFPDHLFINENDSTRLPMSETLEGQAANNTNNFLRLWKGTKSHPDGSVSIVTWYD